MGITISIIAGDDQKSSSVSASGSIQHIITDTERNTFKLSDDGLKKAVDKYFGKRPNDAYLHSPTPWDDLYKRYGWPQVQTIVRPTKAEILSITSEPTIVATRIFKNNSSVKGTFNAGIEESVTDTVTSSWSTGGTLTIGQEIEYGIKFLGSGVSGTTSMSYSQSWEVGGTHEKTTTVGSTSGVTVELNPGESVKSILTASRGVMKVRVTYHATLNGSTAVNYNPKYKDHHFWGLNIDKVMNAANLDNSLKYTEDIEIGYYSDAVVELQNVNGQSLKRVEMASMPGIQASEREAVMIPELVD